MFFIWGSPTTDACKQLNTVDITNYMKKRNDWNWYNEYWICVRGIWYLKIKIFLKNNFQSCDIFFVWDIIYICHFCFDQLSYFDYDNWSQKIFTWVSWSIINKNEFSMDISMIFLPGKRFITYFINNYISRKIDF